MSAGGDLRVKTSSGETYIAASQRPDGTWRKARKVKTGHIPQDEQPKFECRAQQALRQNAQSSTLKYPVGWSPQDMHKPNGGVATTAKPTNNSTTVPKPATIPANIKKPVAYLESCISANIPITPSDHIRKKIGNLEKKLDDIQKLQNKIQKGEVKNPEKTQLQKIERKSAIESEIDALTKQLETL